MKIENYMRFTTHVLNHVTYTPQSVYNIAKQMKLHSNTVNHGLLLLLKSGLVKRKKSRSNKNHKNTFVYWKEAN